MLKTMWPLGRSCIPQRTIVAYRGFTTPNSTNKRNTSVAPKTTVSCLSFITTRFVRYLKYQEAVLDKYLPSVASLYRLFKSGIALYVQDVKQYIQIYRNVRSKGSFELCTRQELEVYHKVPKDTSKLLPILAIFALPFGICGALPLAYMFPRHLLSSHFWTLQQKSSFHMIYLTSRLKHNRLVFRHLQRYLGQLKEQNVFEHWKTTLALIGSGTHPTPEQVLYCKELFRYEPYALKNLHWNHAVQLMKMHGLTHPFIIPRRRLKKHALLLLEMDKAVLREGGVENLSPEAIRTVCYYRGLNPANMRTCDIILWLNKWLTLTNDLTENYESLILHAPILLGYNEPSNWRLIYPKR